MAEVLSHKTRRIDEGEKKDAYLGILPLAELYDGVELVPEDDDGAPAP